jgi:hypothetical protein
VHKNLSSINSTGDKGSAIDSTTNRKKSSTQSQPVAKSWPDPSLRGGDDGSIPCSIEKQTILEFIRSNGSSLLENFHIQGWRWHTKSLIREVGRLHALASRTSLQNAESLREATDYVIGFNLKGLHKIETGLFFPWMRQKLTSTQNKHLSTAFGTVMDELERDRTMVEELGKSICTNVAMACDSRQPETLRKGAIKTVADQSARLQEFARNMAELEDTYLVPAVAAIVPDKEQKTFNTKVLRGLGILDSRLHLVSMYEAVWEDKNNLKEKELFRQAIPSVPQMMIPRWKRKLYAPKTYMLE